MIQKTQSGWSFCENGRSATVDDEIKKWPARIKTGQMPRRYWIGWKHENGRSGFDRFILIGLEGECNIFLWGLLKITVKELGWTSLEKFKFTMSQLIHGIYFGFIYGSFTNPPRSWKPVKNGHFRVHKIQKFFENFQTLQRCKNVKNFLSRKFRPKCTMFSTISRNFYFSNIPSLEGTKLRSKVWK